jgi:aminoglycoside phosphotransferase (APT) family kinase protein
VRLDQHVFDFLVRAGLLGSGETPEVEPLSGGVSSDIWVVRPASSQPFCVKRALPRLRVAAEWRADVARNQTEVRWLRQVAALNRDMVPAVLASDAAAGAFAMEYLPPSEYEPWKAALARGVVSLDTAAAVGRWLAFTHAAFARSATAAADFQTDTAFHALRLEPYLLATARAHPDLAGILEGLAERTAQMKTSVAHGDVSPKNILLGSRGPVFLDAECACFGDPAFDVAFCLNHLLLKTMWVPAVTGELLAAFDVLAEAYLGGVDWEPPSALDERAATLLPGLLLARIDGKSPVEYITDETKKQVVRDAARDMLRSQPTRLADVRGAWMVRA